jgi:cell division protein FtsB
MATDFRTPPTQESAGSGVGSLTGRALALLITIAVVGVLLAVPVRNWFGQRAEIAELRAQIEVTQERVDSLQLEQRRWDDPAFVAAEARRRLHFVNPGEIGYVALGADGRPAAETISELAAERNPTWHAKLWGAVQEADDSVEPTSD